MRFASPAALTLTLLAASLGCKTVPRQAKVEGILLAQADSLLKVSDGETLVVTPGAKVESATEEKHIRLAIAREVLWSEVRGIRKQLLSAGKVPHLLVASGNRLGGMELYEELEGEAIEIVVSVEGKLCVSPPNTAEAKCVQRPDKKHVDRSHTRELVREAVKVYHLHDVSIRVPPDLKWADLVRAVDGARTCCFEDKVRVRLK